MGKFLVKFLEPGMEVLKDIYCKDGILLYNKGVTISKEIIEDLNSREILVIYINAPQPSLENIEKCLADESDVPKLVSAETQVAAFKNVKSVVQKISKGEAFDIEETRKVADTLIAQISRNEDAMVNLIYLKSYDDYTFAHSVNVAVLSTVIGKEMGMPKDELFDLALGGILHDIGKIMINEDILNKRGRLTREEFYEIMKHPEYSYRLLKNKNISEKAKDIALEHHEWYNGTGYPKKLKGSRISLYARICAIADVYDALTAEKAYRAGLNPHKALTLLINSAGKQFDPEVLRNFVQRMTLYPVNSIVQMNDGRYAVVIENFRSNMVRPLVRILELASDGSFVDTGEDLDLAHNGLGVYIKEIVEMADDEVLDNQELYNNNEKGSPAAPI